MSHAKLHRSTKHAGDFLVIYEDEIDADRTNYNCSYYTFVSYDGC